MHMPRFCLLVLLSLVTWVAPLRAQQPTPPPPASAPTAPNPSAPTPPAPTPTPAPAPPTTPPTVVSPPGTHHISLRARRVVYGSGFVQFLDDVTLESEGVSVKAAKITYDTETNQAVAEGNVSIQTPDGNTYWGNILDLDTITLHWRFRDWSVAYPASFLGQPFIGPLFVGGKEVSGLPGLLHAQQARVTTCDEPVPHYFLLSDRVDIYPGDKLIAYDSDLYVLGRKVLHVPWFILWLKQKRSPLVPDAGYNTYEGYYLRLLYQYVVNPDELGGVRLDITQKLGLGAGVDHFYTVPNGNGEAFVYGRQNLSEYVLRLDHTQHLPDNVNIDFTGDTRNDSLFSDQATTLTNLTLRATQATAHTNSLFTYNRYLNQGAFPSDSSTADFTFDANSPVNTFHLGEEYSDFVQTGSTENTQTEDLWSHLQAMHHLDFGNLNLRVDDFSDLGSTPGTLNNSGVERLPEVYLESDQSQLHWNLLQALPSHFTTGFGIFDELSSGVNLPRFLFNWDTQPRPLTFGNTTFSPTASFRQTVYGDQDHTAQYNYQAGLTANTVMLHDGKTSLTNVATYGRQGVDGFTPFSFDAVYPYETTSDSLELVTPSSQSYLTLGRDLQNHLWQDLTFRTAIQFNPSFSMGQSVAYDFNTGEWRDLVSQFHWETGTDHPSFYFDLSSRYDLLGQQLRSVSTSLAWVINPLWKVQWLGGYDGIRHELLYNEYLFTRDLHCWDASFYLSQQTKSFTFYLRMKALNLPMPQFGIGNAGQLLTPSQGMPY